MRNTTGFIVLSALALTACGLENVFSNTGREAYLRPASVVAGKSIYGDVVELTVTDADGNELEPFETTFGGDGTFEFRLPSANYTMLYVVGVAGNMTFRAIVPRVGEEDESSAVNVDLGARSTLEALIAEARL
jgi:hypothetical protein